MFALAYFLLPRESKPILLEAPKTLNPEIGRPGGIKSIAAMRPQTLNPYLSADNDSTDVVGQMFMGLVNTHPLTAELEPGLAESWSLSPDKQTYTLKLRPDLKWSDGHPLTVDDVIFTYTEIINNKHIAHNYRDGMMIQGLDGEALPLPQKIDDLTVSFWLPRPFADFLNFMSAPLMPRHVFIGKTAPDALGNVSFLQMWGLDTKPEDLVVCGPWRLHRFVPGECLELSRNPHYYLKDEQGQTLPYLDKLVFIEIDNIEPRIQKFNQGLTDALQVPPELLGHIKRKDAHIYDLGPHTGSQFLMFNLSRACNQEGNPVVEPFKSRWFHTKVFRQALAHAIDKTSLIHHVYHGQAYARDSYIAQQSVFYHSALKRYDYDLFKARSLLKSAGYTWDPQGWLLDPEGRAVTFRLNTVHPDYHFDGMCRLLVWGWGAIGIRVDYQALPFSELMSILDQSLDWDVMLVGMTGSLIKPHANINMWRLDGRMHLFNKGHQGSWKGLHSTCYEPWEHEILALYEQAARESSRKKQQQLYWDAQAIVAEQVPIIPLVSPRVLIAVSDRLGNVCPSLNAGSRLNSVNWNVEQQFVKHP